MTFLRSSFVLFYLNPEFLSTWSTLSLIWLALRRCCRIRALPIVLADHARSSSLVSLPVLPRRYARDHFPADHGDRHAHDRASARRRLRVHSSHLVDQNGAPDRAESVFRAEHRLPRRRERDPALERTAPILSGVALRLRADLARCLQPRRAADAGAQRLGDVFSGAFSDTRVLSGADRRAGLHDLSGISGTAWRGAHRLADTLSRADLLFRAAAPARRDARQADDSRRGAAVHGQFVGEHPPADLPDRADHGVVPADADRGARLANRAPRADHSDPRCAVRRAVRRAAGD